MASQTLITHTIPSGGTEIKLKLFFDTRQSTWLKSLKTWSDDRYKYDAEDADCIDEVPSSSGFRDDPTN